MSIFVIKIVAVFFMFVDHIKYAFPSCVNEFTIYFGRIAFPLFAFCAVESYFHTSNLQKYIKRLLIAGIISEIPFLLFDSLPTLNSIGLNIEFTLVLGILAIKAYEYCDNKKKGLFLVGIVGLVAHLSKVDYGFFGVLLIFSFYIFHDSKLKTFLLTSFVISGKYLFRLFIYNNNGNLTEYFVKNWICTLIPIIIVLLYNGKKGLSLKWLFYIFYPLHLLILYLLSPYTFNILNF